MFNANITSLEKKVVVVNSYTHEVAAAFATQSIAMRASNRKARVGVDRMEQTTSRMEEAKF